MRRNMMVVDKMSDLLRELGHFMLVSISIPLYQGTYHIGIFIFSLIVAILLWIASLLIIKFNIWK